MRRGLQITLAILSLLPISIGTIGILLGTVRWLPASMVTPDFDSHYRYIAGYYLSLGMLGFWMIPKIERHTHLFRIVCASVFMGGLGRVASILQVGLPNPMAIFFTVFELCFPLLILWQTKVARLQGGNVLHS